VNVVTESIDQSQPIAVTGQETLTRERSGDGEPVNRRTERRRRWRTRNIFIAAEMDYLRQLPV